MARLATLASDCEDILASFAAALADPLAELDVDVPARQYLNPGSQVAWDEPQLTIAILRIYMGEPGQQVSQSSIAGQFHQSVSLGILLVVPVPALQSDGSLPATAPLDAAGQMMAALTTTVWRTAIALRVSNALSPGGGSVAIGPCDPLGPEGGYAGVSLQIDMSVL